MENIKDILKEVEQKMRIRILYACETGSRAWGFPSPDSDYDVRFIYMHERDWYLSLSQKKDTIEHMEGDLDITGWDLKKSLVLLKRSNAALIERFQSPIEYFAVPGFKEDFTKLVKLYYSRTAVFFHHYSLAKKFRDEIKDKDEFKLKSFFYLIRSLLSCSWIMVNKSVVPMHMDGLMKGFPEEINEKLEGLIALKTGVDEKYMHKKDPFLHNWVTGVFDILDRSDHNPGTSNMNMVPLNKFFLRMLHNNADN